MSRRYQFIVDYESDNDCGIGVIPTIEAEGETATSSEIAVVLRKLAKVYDRWPPGRPTIPVRYRGRTHGG